MTLSARVRVSIGGFALDAGLEIGPGEIVALVGPNGAGKSTLLRSLAGLQPIDRGGITIAGTVVDDPDGSVWVPPEDRRIGIVFQDLLLFPRLSVLENVAFGLRASGRETRTAHRLAEATLDRLGIRDLARRRPVQLSGGQAQQVALARAMAIDPAVLALDEPLSALDVETRATVRAELRRHVRAFPGPTLLVTHDPLDAVTLADRLVVLEAGRVVQQGSVAEVTERPRSEWAARLVGVNLFRGRSIGNTVQIGEVELTTAHDLRGDVFAAFRPQAVSLHADRPEGSPRNVWPGRVAGIDVLAGRVRVGVRGHLDAVAEITPAALSELALAEGSPVWLSVKATEIEVYPA